MLGVNAAQPRASKGMPYTIHRPLLCGSAREGGIRAAANCPSRAVRMRAMHAHGRETSQLSMRAIKQ